MLEHFHAGHDVISAAMLRILEIIDETKCNFRTVRESLAAVVVLTRIDIRTHRVWKQVNHLSEKGTVATSVIEQAATGVRSNDFASQPKTAPMAPRYECAAREDLLLCVMPGLYIFRHR
jgi:hypothetical protein